MTSLLTVDSLISLITLSLLEIVLGIDNVIFVSILMGRLKAEQKLAARRLWMILGISVRILLLLALGWLVTNGNKELFGLNLNGQHYGFNLRNMILFGGGLFLLYKTVKEIHGKLEGEHELNADGKKAQASFFSIVSQIILIDMIFSFDDIISYVSQRFTLKKGDLIFTGTPAGVGKINIGDLLEGYISDRKMLSVPVK
jgi:predicted tellurium resistance membrane protein TerC